MYSYPFFEVEKDVPNRVARVYLNRPDARNSMNWSFWRDLPLLVEELDRDAEVRAVVVLARGKSFSMGLDLLEFFEKFDEILHSQTADGREKLLQLILAMQSGLNRIAASPKAWIAGIHKHCVGGGLDLIAACDIRYCTDDASFSLRETKVAIVADMGSLNRLPGIIGMSNTRLMALTGRDFSAGEAQRMGLVSESFPDQATMNAAAEKTAREIAANPAIAVRGTKQVLNYGQNHSVEDGLHYVAVWNASMLDSLDLREFIAAFREKRRPRFQD